MNFRLIFYIGVGLTMAASEHVARASDGLRTVVLSGRSIPGEPAGTTFLTTGTAVINTWGEVALSGSLQTIDPPERFIGAYYSEGGGTPRVVARRGDPVPGRPETTVFAFGELWRPKIADSGRTTLIADILDTTTSPTFGLKMALFADDGSRLSTIVASGDPAVGLADDASITFPLSVFSTTLGDDGWFLYSGLSRTPAPDFLRGTVLYSNTGFGPSVPLLATGQPAPGLGADVEFGERLFAAKPVGDRLPLLVRLQGLGVDSRNDDALFLYTPSETTLLAREGDPAPHLPAETIASLDGNGLPTLSERGDLLVMAGLSSPERVQIDFVVLKRDAAGSWSTLLRPGDPVPSGASDEVFSRLFGPIASDERGGFALRARIASPGMPTREALVERDGEGVRAIAVEGDLAPGTPAGFRFGSLWPESRIARNRHGQTAFLADIGNSTDPTLSGRAIYGQTLDGELRLIAREGGLLDVSDDPLTQDLREISFLDFEPNSGSGGSSGLNDAGQIVFEARFTDGTNGVFVSNIVLVPEPATWPLMIVGMSAVSWRRR